MTMAPSWLRKRLFNNQWLYNLNVNANWDCFVSWGFFSGNTWHFEILFEVLKIETWKLLPCSVFGNIFQLLYNYISYSHNRWLTHRGMIWTQSNPLWESQKLLESHFQRIPLNLLIIQWQPYHPLKWGTNSQVEQGLVQIIRQKQRRKTN